VSSVTDARRSQLRLAVRQIRAGRGRHKGLKLTFAAVAREAGVSTALIHNCYPEIAELIREQQGRSSRAQRDAKREQLRAEQDKTRELRKQLKELERQIASLASINEVLLIENRELKAELGARNVVRLTR
jgi:septal ring factor EnvC (AmiA/AmiB activator)